MTTLAELQRYAPDLGPYRVAEPPAWLDELDLSAAPPFLKMGTHALDLDRWLLVDEHYAAELALRHRLLAERHDIVFGAVAGSEEGSAEVLRLVQEWLTAHHVEAPPVCGGVHPLEAAGRLVQEDLCLVTETDEGWRLTAGVLCFPTFWSLREKLGHPLGDVHAPVAHYRDELETRVDRFLPRLRVDAPVWRRNWGVSPFPLLFLPLPKASLPWTRRVDDDGEPLWFRSERQTLRRLPDSGAVLFTIRTQLVPLGTVCRAPGIAARLLASLESWDDDAVAYKMATSGLRPALLNYLRTVVADTPTVWSKPCT